MLAFSGVSQQLQNPSIYSVFPSQERNRILGYTKKYSRITLLYYAVGLCPLNYLSTYTVTPPLFILKLFKLNKKTPLFIYLFIKRNDPVLFVCCVCLSVNLFLQYSIWCDPFLQQ